MIQNFENWLLRRLKLLDDMDVLNEHSIDLRSVRIGKFKIFLSHDETKEVISVLKRLAQSQNEG